MVVRRRMRRDRYRGDMRGCAVPYLEPIVGGLWWTVGAAALDGGVGTVVLAAGLGVTGAMVVALRRRPDAGPQLPPGDRGRLLRLLGITAALVAVVGTALGYFQLGELAVPLACAMVGVALVPVSSLLDERSLLASGAALMVLGAVGALLALDSAGRLYPQGVVGLVAGALLWVAGAHRSGLLAEARARTRR
jgi:hypothetical protein